ncbi:MAG: SdrD B-like domain-containing protein, partial [Pirellulales bacterium]
SGISWTNDSTIAAWSLFNKTPAAITAIVTSDGSSNSGSFYNFGTTASADRAVGGAASGGAYFGSPTSGSVAGWITVAVTNNTGIGQSAFTIRYDGEQWRNGGNATAQTMVAEYGYGSTFAGVGSWAAAGSAFNFTSPVATATAAPLDGNAAANRLANIGGTVTPATPWAAGTTLWIRWIETNDAGNDHGLAIDNFSFSLPTTVVTAPTAPTITGITAGDGQLSVAFAAPSSDGGAAITTYQYSLNGGTAWTTPAPAVTSSPLVITGLTNGQTYSVLLRAVNSAGAGPASAAVSGKPLGTDYLRIVSYNITAADTLPRTGLGTLVQAMAAESVGGHADQVDLLAIQEVASQGTTSANVAATLNAIYGTGTYAFGSLNGTTTGSGTQGVVYNTQALQLLEERAVGTASSTGGPRQTLRYKFQPKNGDASAVFYVYNSHWKSLDTADDAARRDVEARAIRTDADALPDGTSIIYVGDYNLYRSSEPAYQTMLGAGNGQSFDPLSRPGDWHSNSSFVDIFTQAPLQTAPAGFTGGGLDDRFDFQLVSGEVMTGGGLKYKPGSYRTFGNNGSVPRNGSINSSSSTALPGLANRTEVLNLLTTVADHLPVVVDYSYPKVAAATPAITVTPSTLGAPLTTTFGTASAPATLSVSGLALSGSLTVTPATGLEVSLASGSGYAASLSLAPTGGTLAPTTVYVRLAATAAVGNYNAAVIAITGGGATAQAVVTTASGNTVSPSTGTMLFSEDFSALTVGNSSSTSGSSTAWTGSSNWSSVTAAYQAGSAVKLGTSGAGGSITTKTLDLTGNGGSFTVSFDVKGWTTVEGSIVVTVSGLAPQTVTYSATMSGAFETKTLSFTGGQANSTITFASTSKRAFLDTITVIGGTPEPPRPASIAGFAWNDANGNGTWDLPAEVAAAGWTIYLDTNRDGQLDAGEPSTITGTDGSYAFTGLTAGTYTVAQVPQAGWQQTSPATTGAAVVRSLSQLLVSGADSLGSTVLPSDPAYAPPLRQQQKRFVPNDPLFTNQWHLRNTGQSSGTVGEDARVVAAWD